MYFLFIQGKAVKNNTIMFNQGVELCSIKKQPDSKQNYVQSKEELQQEQSV